MAVFDKARIKLLDKKNGEVLKEIDPLTSADAVDYDGVNTVKDKIISLNNYNATNDTTIAALEQADIDQASFSNTLNTKINNQQTAIDNMTTQNSTQDADIATLKTQMLTTIKFNQF